MTNGVNPDSTLLPHVLEVAMRQLRSGLYELSDSRFPGLRTRHYRLLSFIPDAGVRLARVVEESGLTKQALAQALKPLEDGGYVEGSPDPVDARARIVRRTPRGDEVLTAVRAMQAGHERAWAAQVGPERWTTAREVLDELFAH